MQVATVIPYFDRWVAKWPTVRDLAGADVEAVNAMWAGLGYYRRARYLLDGAKYVVEQLQGEFPTNAKDLLAIPGAATARAAVRVRTRTRRRARATARGREGALCAHRHPGRQDQADTQRGRDALSSLRVPWLSTRGLLSTRERDAHARFTRAPQAWAPTRRRRWPPLPLATRRPWWTATWCAWCRGCGRWAATPPSWARRTRAWRRPC